MSIHDPIDDLWLKTQPVNHLASPLERQAAAGAALPTLLNQRVAHIKHLNTLIHQLLPSLLGDELTNLCQVVYADGGRLTLALPSMTAVNYLRYLQVECLNTLKQHPAFLPYHELKIILNTQPKHDFGNTQKTTKNPLSENTKHTITQSANLVITHEKLRKSLLSLADDLY